MDNTEKLTLLSFCTGYGGIESGIERAIGEVRVLAHVEIEAYAIANLVAKMESEQMVPSPVWTDLKTFPSEIFRDKVDILTGGYPCQPFSAAGKRLGEDDPRHLWPHIRRTINIIRPRTCFFENVEGHISLGLSTVISDLEEDGYRCSWGIFSASEVGASHQRKRVFIMANRKDIGCGGWQDRYRADQRRIQESQEEIESMVRSEAQGCCGDSRGEKEKLDDSKHNGLSASKVSGSPEPRNGTQEREAKSKQSEGSDSCGVRGEELANSENRGGKPTEWEGRESIRGGSPNCKWAEKKGGIFRQIQAAGSGGEDAFPAGPGQFQYDWEEPRTVTKSKLGGTDDGTANRVDRLRLLGNGVVSATSEKAFKTLLGRLK